jgi:hypothetical protein
MQWDFSICSLLFIAASSNSITTASYRNSSYGSPHFVADSCGKSVAFNIALPPGLVPCAAGHGSAKCSGYDLIDLRNTMSIDLKDRTCRRIPKVVEARPRKVLEYRVLDCDSSQATP